MNLPTKVLRPAGELQRGRSVGLARRQPASHFPRVAELKRDGAIIAGDRSGVAGVRLVDELDGRGVVGSEGLKGLHFDFIGDE